MSAKLALPEGPEESWERRRLAWERQLEILLKEEALAIDARHIFTLEKLIEEARGAIADLRAGRTPSVPSPSPPPRISIHRLPSSGRHFVARQDELARLDRAWDDPHVYVLSIVAWGRRRQERPGQPLADFGRRPPAADASRPRRGRALAAPAGSARGTAQRPGARGAGQVAGDGERGALRRDDARALGRRRPPCGDVGAVAGPGAADAGGGRGAVAFARRPGDGA